MLTTIDRRYAHADAHHGEGAPGKISRLSADARGLHSWTCGRQTSVLAMFLGHISQINQDVRDPDARIIDAVIVRRFSHRIG